MRLPEGGRNPEQDRPATLLAAAQSAEVGGFHVAHEYVLEVGAGVRCDGGQLSPVRGVVAAMLNTMMQKTERCVSRFKFGARFLTVLIQGF